MKNSVLDLFKIGIGPSSSHTVGPMRAAREFLLEVDESVGLNKVNRLQADLFGSLSFTGKGHGTDVALILGFMGFLPENFPVEKKEQILLQVEQERKIHLLNKKNIAFNLTKNITFHKRNHLKLLHPNAMKFTAIDELGGTLLEKSYYSIGGGFIASSEQLSSPHLSEEDFRPYPFNYAKDLIGYCEEEGLSISGLAFKNEQALHPNLDIKDYFFQVWQVMEESVNRGLVAEGVLPGGLKVKRRAPGLYQQIKSKQNSSPLEVLDWVNVFALAVSEENASGGRIVTAPTNGAAGIIPAVLKFYQKFYQNLEPDQIFKFLLASGSVGLLYKMKASLSGAEVGCQGEVGVACSMAAAGLTEIMGGTPRQVENAAEIGMEHNLGLTCDPVNGLVQIPCIERNAMGAIKAINASHLALKGDGRQKVSLDQVIKTMYQTGLDMRAGYKETSKAGLAKNIIEC